jgi:hypothetical protein
MISWTRDMLGAAPVGCVRACSRFFPGDVVTLCGGSAEDCGCLLRSSDVRRGVPVAGVLVLSSAITLGRGQRGKCLYAFRVPRWGSLVARVPYAAPGRSFLKAREDKYVLARFVCWDAPRPTFRLVETFGDVSQLAAYDKFLLARHCRSAGMAALRDAFRGACTAPALSSPVSRSAYTIDPAGSRDLDDALSVTESGGAYTVDVHITDVARAIDDRALWSCLGGACQSVYLSSVVANMLPRCASHGELSLLEGSPRGVLTLSFHIGEHVRVVGWKREELCVASNATYETVESAHPVFYRTLVAATHRAASLRGVALPADSHEVVAYWMLAANEFSGSLLAASKLGVFRVCRERAPAPLESALGALGLRELRAWQSSYAPWEEELEHAALGIGAYAQVTSPLRRLGDLVNQVFLVEGLSTAATEFACAWATPEGTTKLTDWSRAARRAERCSRLADASLRAAGAQRWLSAVVCSSEGVTAWLYVQELGGILPIRSPAAVALRPGREIRLMVHIRAAGWSLPGRIAVELEVEGLAGGDVLQCEVPDLVEDACETGLVDDDGGGG